jgi:hypothetical protein
LPSHARVAHPRTTHRGRATGCRDGRIRKAKCPRAAPAAFGSDWAMGDGLGLAFWIRQKIKAGQRVRPFTHVHENKVQRERLKNSGCRISHQSPVLGTRGTGSCSIALELKLTREIAG